MSENINQVFMANPITTNAATDLMYFGQSPYGAGNDAAMLFSDFNAQIVANGTANQIGYYATTGNKISPITAANNGVLITNNTGIPSLLANSGTPGFVLTSNSGAPPSWQALGAASGAVLLNPAANQNIIAHNLFVSGGGFIAGAATTPGLGGSGTINAVGVTVAGTLLAASYTNTTGSPNVFCYKSRSTTPGSFVTVQANDFCARWQVWGDDGTQFSPVGQMTWQAVGAISSGVIPGTCTLQTSNSSGAQTTAWTVDSSQVFTLTHPLAVTSGGTGITAFGTGVAAALGQNVNGSGAISLTTSPTFVTPTLGAASATSINFGGTSLANYVEGAFNITLTPGTLGDWSVVYANQSCNYTRIGNKIFVDAVLVCTPTFTTASGNLIFGGLPLPVNGVNSSVGGGTVPYNSSGITYPALRSYLSVFPTGGTSTFVITANGSAQNTLNLAVSNIVSGVQIVLYFSFEYTI